MFTRIGTSLPIIAVALLATIAGALLGWGVMRLKGGAAAMTQPPPSLALNQRPGATPSDSEEDGRAAETDATLTAQRTRSRAQRIQGSNAPERLVPTGTPRLAIVIDDIGQTLSAPRELLALGVPITFSVLPKLTHSRQAAEMIARAHREFIIHLPMEPLDYPVHDPGPQPLLLSLDASETRQRIEAYFRDLPGATGASNHMGSAYTADAGRMAMVQRILADHNVFFLNSKTSASGVPAAVAHRGNYSYLERDVFLDNERDERFIARALDQALSRAQRHGHAIAIGHPYPETVQVLQQALTRPQIDGVTLVSLSDLLDP